MGDNADIALDKMLDLDELDEVYYKECERQGTPCTIEEDGEPIINTFEYMRRDLKSCSDEYFEVFIKKCKKNKKMKKEKRREKWTTEDGKKIRVCDMENDHLINAIRMLYRGAAAKLIWKKTFYDYCPEPNGDEAKKAFDQEQNFWAKATWRDVVPEIFWVMVDEVKEREMVSKIPSDIYFSSL